MHFLDRPLCHYLLRLQDNLGYFQHNLSFHAISCRQNSEAAADIPREVLVSNLDQTLVHATWYNPHYACRLNYAFGGVPSKIEFR